MNKRFFTKIADRFSRSIESRQAPSGNPSKLRNVLITLGLFLLSGLILAFFLRDVEWVKVIEASQDANIVLAIFTTVVSWVVSWVVIALVSQKVVQWFYADLPFWDYLWVRGASFILQIINPTLRSGTVMLYKKKKSKISWQALWGGQLFLAGVFGWGYALFFIVVTFLYQALGYTYSLDYLPYIMWFVLLVPGLSFLLLSLSFFWYGKDPTRVGRLIVRKKHEEFWRPFYQAKLKHWMYMFSIVWLVVIIHVVAIYYRNIAFGVEVPFIILLGTFALATVVADLPIGYAGFGTTTMAWTYFYGDYGTKEQIVALTIFMPAAGLAVKAMLGGLFLKLGMNAVRRMN